MDRARLVPTRGGVAWAWADDDGALDRVLWPVVWSAVELLTSADLGRIKECPGGGEGPCAWLFVDTSKNAIRRWCSMAECGGEAKSRRQTARRRVARASGTS